MNIYKEYVEWFEALDFFKEYMSKFPEPFNNPAFASAVVLIAVAFLLVSVMENLRNWRIGKRIKRKNRELELKRLEMQMKEEEHRKCVSEMEEYMRFMMMAQMQNMNSLLGMSFEQWRYHRHGYIIPEPESYQEDIPEQEDICITEVESSVEEPEEQMIPTEDENPVEVTEESEYAEEDEEVPELPVSLEEIVDDSDTEGEDVIPVILQHNEPPKESEDREGLTKEQQSDFAKLIAMMQAQEKQKEEIGAYNRQRTEITKNNMEVLDRGLQAASKSEDKKKHGGKNTDSLDKRKQAALEALEADKQKEAGKASGEKRKLFSGRK